MILPSLYRGSFYNISMHMLISVFSVEIRIICWGILQVETAYKVIEFKIDIQMIQTYLLYFSGRI